MYEAKLLIEAGGGTGSIDYSVGTMSSGTVMTVSPAHGSVPEFATGGEVYLANGKSGVISLISLNGTVISSMRQNGSKPAMLSTRNVPKGLYLLRFQGDGDAAETRKLLLQ